MIIILYFITLDIFYILISSSLYNVYVNNCMFFLQFYNYLSCKIGSGAITSKIYYCYYYHYTVLLTFQVNQIPLSMWKAMENMRSHEDFIKNMIAPKQVEPAGILVLFITVLVLSVGLHYLRLLYCAIADLIHICTCNLPSKNIISYD